MPHVLVLGTPVLTRALCTLSLGAAQV
jgi:hypothetical protein